MITDDDQDDATDLAVIREAKANDDGYRISGAELLAKLDAADQADERASFR